MSSFNKYVKAYGFGDDDNNLAVQPNTERWLQTLENLKAESALGKKSK
jgi:hypothetical protein